jgi:hypothetical protein
MIRSLVEARRQAKEKGVSVRKCPWWRSPEVYISEGDDISPQVWRRLKLEMFETGFAEPGGGETISHFCIRNKGKK